MTPKYSPICEDPQKYPSSYKKNKLFFCLKTPKILKFKILNPPKWSAPSYV